MNLKIIEEYHLTMNGPEMAQLREYLESAFTYHQKTANEFEAASSGELDSKSSYPYSMCLVHRKTADEILLFMKKLPIPHSKP